MKPAYLKEAEAAQLALADKYRARPPQDRNLTPGYQLMAASRLLDRAKSAADVGITDADIMALAEMLNPPKITKKK